MRNTPFVSVNPEMLSQKLFLYSKNNTKSLIFESESNSQ